MANDTYRRLDNEVYTLGLERPLVVGNSNLSLGWSEVPLGDGEYGALVCPIVVEDGEETGSKKLTGFNVWSSSPRRGEVVGSLRGIGWDVMDTNDGEGGQD